MTEQNSTPASETQFTESSRARPVATPRLAVLTVLAHPDPTRVGEKVLLPELGSHGEVELGRVTPRFVAKTARRARPLDDLHLSRKPIRLVGGSQGVLLHRDESPMPVKVDGERLDESLEITPEALDRGVSLLLGRRVALLLHLDTAGFEEGRDFGMVGESSEMRRLRTEIRLAACLEVPVLVRGESGTGKELLARAIHDASSRAEKTYLAVNMAAMPETLAAAELFGATKGAYTGADRAKEGYLQRAGGGTLFLDEIAEMPDAVQPLLLRALETGEVQPVGGSPPRRVDVRFVAATDADLEDRIETGSFRAPLLHRLAGFVIRIPPLRARRGDFGRLLVHFLRLELQKLGADWPTADGGRPWPAAALVARLVGLEWPGNIRQLRNVARRLAISQVTGSELELDLEEAGQPVPTPPTEAPHPLEDGVRPGDPGAEPSATPAHGWKQAYRKPSEVGEEELLTTLREHDFELKASAEALGVARASLYLLVQNHPRIRKASDLGADEIRQALASTDDARAAARRLEVSVYALRRQARALGIDLEPGVET